VDVPARVRGGISPLAVCDSREDMGVVMMFDDED
jgi:hypothetical protein